MKYKLVVIEMYENEEVAFVDIYGDYSEKPNDETILRVKRLYPMRDENLRVIIMDESQFFILDKAIEQMDENKVNYLPVY